MMNKNTVIETMMNEYESMAYAHEYMLGYVEDHMVKVAIVPAHMMSKLVKLDSASENAGFSLRFKPDRVQKKILSAYVRFTLCSEYMLETLWEESKYNRGDLFEKLIFEYFGQNWKKTDTRFCDDADITVNGVAYQIKFNKATITNERILLSLRRQGF